MEARLEITGRLMLVLNLHPIPDLVLHYRPLALGRGLHVRFRIGASLDVHELLKARKKFCPELCDKRGTGLRRGPTQRDGHLCPAPDPNPKPSTWDL